MTDRDKAPIVFVRGIGMKLGHLGEKKKENSTFIFICGGSLFRSSEIGHGVRFLWAVINRYIFYPRLYGPAIRCGAPEIKKHQYPSLRGVEHAWCGYLRRVSIRC